MHFKMEKNSFSSKLNYGTLDISADSEHGFRPFQLLVSSIAGCSGGVLRKIFEKMRISFQDIEIVADVTRGEGQVKAVEAIHFTYLIYGSGLSKDKVAKALDIALKNCAMAQSVKGSIQIKKDFKLIEIS